MVFIEAVVCYLKTIQKTSSKRLASIKNLYKKTIKFERFIFSVKLDRLTENRKGKLVKLPPVGRSFNQSSRRLTDK